MVLIFLISCDWENDSDINNFDDTGLLIYMLNNQQFSSRPELFIVPQNGEIDIAPTANISLIFSTEVNTTGDWNVTVDSIEYSSASPEVSWETTCLVDNCYPRLVIHPLRPLMRGKNIAVTASGFMVENDTAHFGDVQSSFRTSEARLYTAGTPLNGTSGYSPDTDVTITFSEPIDMESGWSMTIANVVYNALSPEITWNEAKTTMKVNPNGFFKRNSSVQVVADGFIAAFDGCPYTKYTTSFRIIASPSASINPADGSKAVRTDGNIVLTFTEPMIPDDGWTVTADGIVYNASSPGAVWNSSTKLTIQPSKKFPMLSTVVVALQGFHAVFDNALFSGLLQVSFATGLNTTKINSGYSMNWDAIFSQAIDTAGALYITYSSSPYYGLYYASNTSGSWQGGVLVPMSNYNDAGRFSSIALDPSGAVHIAYSSVVQKYISNASGSWLSETVDPAYFTGFCSSIALDSNGAIHVGYVDNNNYPTRRLKYANNKNGSWANTLIDSGNQLWDVSMALDAGNNVHISYYSNSTLKYATNKSGDWQTYTIEPSQYSGKGSSLAVDSGGNVHLSYVYYGWPDYDRVKYATNLTGSWVIYDLGYADYHTGYTSIALDANDNVHICYFNEINPDNKLYLKCAAYKNGAWSSMIVASSPDLGERCSLAIDSSGYIHVLYVDGSINADFIHATNAP